MFLNVLNKITKYRKWKYEYFDLSENINISIYQFLSLKIITRYSDIEVVSRDAFASFALATIQLFAGAER